MRAFQEQGALGLILELEKRVDMNDEKYEMVENNWFCNKLSFWGYLGQNYFIGTNFKPNFLNFRVVITKFNSLITSIDDMYDVYETFEELQLFMKVIERWDPKPMDNLPDYMKICFLALYIFLNDLGHQILKENGFHFSPYLKGAVRNLFFFVF
ncbi:hypothetical protein Lal_00027858 [Lupinus albus]|nr:hypothetical protein Lal_00027858 [Lupinus albus]